MAIGCDQSNKSNSELSNDNQIIIGHIDSLKSDILGETRKIWVHVPKNYEEGKKYPVLYLLDGPGHFHSVTGLIKQLSANGTAVLPEMIVIAIPNTNNDHFRKNSCTIGTQLYSCSSGNDRYCYSKYK